MKPPRETAWCWRPLPLHLARRMIKAGWTLGERPTTRDLDTLQSPRGTRFQLREDARGVRVRRVPVFE